MPTPHVPLALTSRDEAARMLETLRHGRMVTAFPLALPPLTDVVVDLALPLSGRVLELHATVAFADSASAMLVVYGVDDSVIAPLLEVAEDRTPRVPAAAAPADPGPTKVDPFLGEPQAAPFLPSADEVPSVDAPPGSPDLDAGPNSLEVFLTEVSESRPVAPPPPPSRPAASPPRATVAHGAPPPATPRAAATDRSMPSPLGGPPVDALADYAGDLSKQDWRSVLLELVRRRRTGVLFVEGFRERRWCYFVDGLPVRFQRDPPSPVEEFGQVAVDLGLVPPAAARRHQDIARMAGLPEDEVFARFAGIPAARVDEARRELATRVTRYLLSANYGTFAFYPVPELEGVLPRTPARIGEPLLQAARTRWSRLTEAQFARQQDGRLELRWLPVDEAAPLLAELPLSMPERRFTERYLPGGWTLKEILQRQELPDRQAVELVLSLVDLGVAELAESEGPRRDRLRLQRLLLDRKESLKKDDLFDFVGAHWSCVQREIQQAMERMDALIAPTPLEAELSADQRQVLADTRARVVEAKRVLLDTAVRVKYRNERISAGQREMSADLFSKQAEMALFKNDPRLADLCFERALELDPGGAEGEERRARSREMLRKLRAGEKPGS